MEGFSFHGVALGQDERGGQISRRLVTIARAIVAT
jgi:hypothetical protein